MFTVSTLLAFVVGGAVGLLFGYTFYRNNPNKVAKIEAEVEKLKNKVGL